MEQPHGAKRGAKRPSASTHQRSGRKKKAPKLISNITTQHVNKGAKDVTLLNQHVDKDEDVGASIHRSSDGLHTPDNNAGEGAEDIGAIFKIISATKRSAYHSGLIEKESKIIAFNMELKIAAEARGVTGKDVPWEIFCSIYLCDFSTEAEPKLAVDSVQEIGNGDWAKGKFWKRLRKVLSGKVRCSGCALILLSIFC